MSGIVVPGLALAGARATAQAVLRRRRAKPIIPNARTPNIAQVKGSGTGATTAKAVIGSEKNTLL